MRLTKKGCARSILISFGSLTGLCLVLIALIVLLNSKQPSQSAVLDRLSTIDKARLAEVTHLRKVLGDQVMPGWSEANIPLIVYNEAYLFLIGRQDPPTGWRKVPQGTQMGQAWEIVPGDDFYGQVYYRQRIPASGVTTQAFTVQLGDDWAASLGTFEWMRISLIKQIRQDVPPALQPVIPYFLVANLLVPGSDAYASFISHEAMHAYQGIRAPQRLVEAEQSSLLYSMQYPWEDQSFRDAWQVELDLLNEAMRAKTQDETHRLARAFLENRTTRRSAANLSSNLIDYERQREWEEGIAKYAERSIYLLASLDQNYQPLPEMSQDTQFHDYKGAQLKWNQEVDQIRRMAADEGDGRFYYSGFAQAVLLDRLMPEWKQRLFEPDTWLEDMLAEGLK